MQLVKECIVTVACYSRMLAVQRLRNCACEIQLADILALFLAVRYMPQGAVKNKYCADVFWMNIVLPIFFKEILRWWVLN